MNIALEPLLYIAAALIAVGTYGLLTRKDPVASLLSLQIITHAILIALVALGRGLASGTPAEATFPDTFAALVIAVLGTQAVVGLSLVLYVRRGGARGSDSAPE